LVASSYLAHSGGHFIVAYVRSSRERRGSLDHTSGLNEPRQPRTVVLTAEDRAALGL
jgi:hypothetical protein